MHTEAAGLPHRAGSNASTQLGEIRMPDAISLSPVRQMNRWACPIEYQWSVIQSQCQASVPIY